MKPPQQEGAKGCVSNSQRRDPDEGRREGGGGRGGRKGRREGRKRKGNARKERLA